jgi:tetratricopeptide (TPR) repeat protein
MRPFKELLADYRAHGASSLRSELPDILHAAELPDAKKGFMWFASDICLDLELLTESQKILEKIAARFGVCDILHNNMAFCLTSAGDNEAAVAHYRKSLELNPENSSSVRGLALTLNEMGKFDEAQDYAVRWQVLRPQETEAAELIAELANKSAAQSSKSSQGPTADGERS